MHAIRLVLTLTAAIAQDMESLQVRFALWTPGDQPLDIASLASENVTPAEQQLLEGANLTGSIVIPAGFVGGSTSIPGRMLVLIEHALTRPVHLRLPDRTTVVCAGPDWRHLHSLP